MAKDSGRPKGRTLRPIKFGLDQPIRPGDAACPYSGGPLAIAAHVSPVLGPVRIEDVGAARKPRELSQGRLEVRVEPFVARAAERDEVLLGRGPMHAPRDEVMHVKFNIDVVGGPPPAHDAPVTVALDYLRPEFPVGARRCIALSGRWSVT